MLAQKVSQEDRARITALLRGEPEDKESRENIICTSKAARELVTDVNGTGNALTRDAPKDIAQGKTGTSRGKKVTAQLPPCQF